MSITQKMTMNWHGIPIEVYYRPDRFPALGEGHLVIVSPQPLPGSPIGYLQYFPKLGAVAAGGNLAAYVRALLDEAEWSSQGHKAKAAQLSLF